MAEGRLEGRAAIVTGAARGVGRALALKLAREGARVLANDLEADGLGTLTAEVESAGGNCVAFPGDVTDEQFGDRVVAECIERFGDLHIVVNNAGYIWNSRIVNHTDEQWYAMIDVHATGPFRILRAAGRHFRQMHKANESNVTRKVVNVSSLSGLCGADTQFSYAAAKSTQFGMTKSLAKDWGRYNVTVNCVAFGHIETRLTQPYADEIAEIEVKGRRHKVGIPEGSVGMSKMLTPLLRAGSPEDGAGAVFLFCLPESDFITGEIIAASGGLRL